ncbi:MAG: amidophosphoribosyltransferase-like [Geobacteraceae bacterium]|nr:MAG: amidophosphoribosyltransferase-like [Geobacteraceae bacterium]
MFIARSPVPGPRSPVPFFAALIDMLFPPLCHLCKAFIPDAGDVHLCSGCLENNSRLSSPLCIVCGAPFFTEEGIDHLCSGCSTAPPHFTAARAAMLFEGTVKELIHRFKYDKKVQLRRPLGILAAQGLSTFASAASPDLVIPVPLHVKRLKERGFNQAVLLGEVLAGHWRLPLSRDNLRRTRWTEPQINLSVAERTSNVRGAFGIKSPCAVKGKRIILVDDVYTTGSTVAECAKTLKQSGAEKVFVVTVARAVR